MEQKVYLVLGEFIDNNILLQDSFYLFSAIQTFGAHGKKQEEEVVVEHLMKNHGEIWLLNKQLEEWKTRLLQGR